MNAVLQKFPSEALKIGNFQVCEWQSFKLMASVSPMIYAEPILNKCQWILRAISTLWSPSFVYLEPLLTSYFHSLWARQVL